MFLSWLFSSSILVFAPKLYYTANVSSSVSNFDYFHFDTSSNGPNFVWVTCTFSFWFFESARIFFSGHFNEPLSFVNLIRLDGFSLPPFALDDMHSCISFPTNLYRSRMSFLLCWF